MFGGLIQGLTNAAKAVITAPAKVGAFGAKLSLDILTLPTTLTTKVLAKAAPSVFGPVDRALGQVKGLGKGAIDTAEKAVTFVPRKALDAQGRVLTEVANTPFNIAGAAMGLKAPY